MFRRERQPHKRRRGTSHALTEVGPQRLHTQLEEPEDERRPRMGVGVTNTEPIAAMRAVIEIESASVVDSAYRDAKNREQKQFACTLRVLSGAGQRDGETFSEWLSFPADGAISPMSKTGQVVSAALGDGAKAETLEEFAAKLIGKRFAAQIGASRNGRYSRIVHDTISPAPPQTGQEASGLKPDGRSGHSPTGGYEEPDFSDLPF